MYYTGYVRTIYAFLYQFDLVWIFGIMTIVLLILIAAIIVLAYKLNHLSIRYDLFMRGKDCETLEDNILEMYRQMQEIEADNKENKDLVLTMRRNVTGSIAKTALVKYNAFPGMGGEASFALTLLNMEDSGYILDVIHSRENCYVYIREVKKGFGLEILTPEEQESLRRAKAANADNKKA